MIATVNLNFAVDIAPVFRVVPKGYDISSSSAVFELRDKLGAELYAESSAGITVETITLAAPLKYADGTEIAAGTEVFALRVFPDLPPLSLGDPEHVNPVQYRYGLRIDDAWTIQGWLTVWPDTGPAGCMGSPVAVCCGPQQIAVAVGAGVTTTTGIEYLGGYRAITVSGPIIGADSTVEIICGGSDLSISLPAAEDLFSAGKSKQLRVTRLLTDTGLAAITGEGSDLIGGYLAPGESFIIESNGTSLLLM